MENRKNFELEEETSGEKVTYQIVGEDEADLKLGLINISSPIAFHLLAHSEVIVDQTFMLQKEVVDRMAALPSTAEYGRLSVMAQYWFVVTPLFNVPPIAFRPPSR